MKVVLLRNDEDTGWDRLSVIGAKEKALRLWEQDWGLDKFHQHADTWDRARYVWAETEVDGVLRLDLLGWRRGDPFNRAETGYAIEIRED